MVVGGPAPARLPRPLAGIGLETFQLEYVPRLLAALLAEGPPLPFAGELEVDVGGQSFTFAFGPERIAARAGAATAPLVRCLVSPADFRRGVDEILPVMLRRADKLLSRLRAGLRAINRRLAGFDPQRLRARPGRIELEICDDAGDPVRFVYVVDSGAGPRVLVRLGEDELWKLGESGLKLSRLVATRLHVEGDAAYLVRLATVLEQPAP